MFAFFSVEYPTKMNVTEFLVDEIHITSESI